VTATVHDLVTVRSQRGQAPMHFADDIEALEWIKREVDELRSTAPERAAARLAHVSAVVSAVAVLYGHDERDTR
jgi:hypothetical protein